MGCSLAYAACDHVRASSKRDALSFPFVDFNAQHRASPAYRWNSVASDMTAPCAYRPLNHGACDYGTEGVWSRLLTSGAAHKIVTTGCSPFVHEHIAARLLLALQSTQGTEFCAGTRSADELVGCK